MNRKFSIALLGATHVAVLGVGFALGIYMLPILTAPPSPALAMVQATADSAQYSGRFERDLTDSDALHWGEGSVFISNDSIAFQGELAPGPDYRLYLSPKFVDTEVEFEALKSRMVQVGHVRTFQNFMIDIPNGIDPGEFAAVIIWCETFGQFITATSYR